MTVLYQLKQGYSKIYQLSTQPNIGDLLEQALIFTEVERKLHGSILSKDSTILCKLTRNHQPYLSITHNIQHPDNTKQITSYKCYFWSWQKEH